MEEALLVSGENSDRRRRDPSSTLFNRRSHAITQGSSYQKAAALVDLAEDGIGLPEQILDQSSFESSAKFYFFFTKFDFIWSLNYFALIILNFLEKPLWCSRTTAYSCNDRDYYYLGQLPYLTGSESLIYEGITLILLMIHTLFPISYEGLHIYWKSWPTRSKISESTRYGNNLSTEKRWIKVICLLILVADFLVYALYLSPVAFDFLPLRIAPYVRVVVFILNIRELRDTILILAGMLGTYLNVLALGLLFLLFASWIAYVFFEDTQQGKTVFTSYGTALYQMFILFTTSNNPDVWIPAYKDSRWYCLFFVLYVLLGVYFVTNLILAVVYDSFKDQLAKQVSKMDRMRRHMLEKAFNLIDKNHQRLEATLWCLVVKSGNEENICTNSYHQKFVTLAIEWPLCYAEQNVGFLNKKQCIQLFEELNKYRTLPKISREEFELIFDELDDTHDFKSTIASGVREHHEAAINLDEFNDLCNAIALSFQKEDCLSCFEQFPSVYHSPFSEKLKAFVQSPKFGYIISFILVVNLIAVIVETTVYRADCFAIMLLVEINRSPARYRKQYWSEGLANGGVCLCSWVASYSTGWIYVLEMALKIYSFGFTNYWRDGQNRFDFLVTLIIVIGETMTFASPHGLTFLSNGEWIRYLLLARMLRLIRILMHVQRYRAFLATFLTLIPSLMPYLGTIFCVLCIYCSLGVQIFGGIVNAGNSKVEQTDLADDDYLLFNFNDYPNGMVTLFNLLVMGNWHVWMQSYKELTGTWWTVTYFVSFYLITVLLLLNLVVAFVLEAFFAEIEMEVENSEKCEEEDQDGRRKDRPRTIGAKTRSQRVDILLHHMLSTELEKPQCSNT
ncbi:hypothetical protein JRO89_XS01G0177600 [Xanthoceras sorbifolium]|uniref:Ion transport domain-containing protein n=1 Tax=Xanthoceras sorbifolium TaxID=99658 RepID=A0ABQ8IJU1_9ROSI|nr:hypothetical protein JRO89_XS01G0177600 [Xanthoceras sorbifolium]